VEGFEGKTRRKKKREYASYNAFWGEKTGGNFGGEERCLKEKGNVKT